MAGLEIALANLRLSRAHRPSLSHLRRNSIGHGIFSCAFHDRVAMEPARVPLLLRAFVVQHLCAGCDHRAGAAGANRATEREREEMPPVLLYCVARLELGVPASRESVGVAGAVDRAMPFVAPTPSPRPFECNVSMSDRIQAAGAPPSLIATRASQLPFILSFVPHHPPGRPDVR